MRVLRMLLLLHLTLILIFKLLLLESDLMKQRHLVVAGSPASQGASAAATTATAAGDAISAFISSFLAAFVRLLTAVPFQKGEVGHSRDQ